MLKNRNLATPRIDWLSLVTTVSERPVYRFRRSKLPLGRPSGFSGRTEKRHHRSCELLSRQIIDQEFSWRLHTSLAFSKKCIIHTDERRRMRTRGIRMRCVVTANDTKADTYERTFGKSLDLRMQVSKNSSDMLERSFENIRGILLVFINFSCFKT